MRLFKPFPLFIALRYLRARKQTKFLSFVSLASIVGLMLGVAVLIIVLSIMNGFGHELQQRILGTIPHGKILFQKAVSSQQPVVTPWQTLRQQLLKEPSIVGASPLWELEGMLSYYDRVAGAKVLGVAPALEPTVSQIVEHLVPPLKTLDVLAAGEFRVIIGRALAHQLGLVVGDRVTFVLPETQITPAGILPRYKRFQVAGFFEAGAEIDGYLMFMHWRDAAKLMRRPGLVQGVRLQFADIFAAPRELKAIVERLDEGYISSDWTETHGMLFTAVKMEKLAISILLFLIVMVASFNMVSSFIMLVSEKRADIAILRTMGATPVQIRDIFLLQGFIIGLLGVAAGAAVGLWVSINVTEWARLLESLLGVRFFGAYFVDYLPSIVSLNDVLWVVVSAFLLSLFATFIPARKAFNTEPVDALRYE